MGVGDTPRWELALDQKTNARSAFPWTRKFVIGPSGRSEGAEGPRTEATLDQPRVTCLRGALQAPRIGFQLPLVTRKRRSEATELSVFGTSSSTTNSTQPNQPIPNPPYPPKVPSLCKGGATFGGKLQKTGVIFITPTRKPLDLADFG